MWIDTHCHLDDPSFDADRTDILARATADGVGAIVVPAVHASHLAGVRALAARHGLAYALGIHPLWIGRSTLEDVDRLRDAVVAARDDPRLVAVGEIGLDAFDGHPPIDLQRRFYEAQLKLARDVGLPVLLHVRRTADLLLAGVRRVEVTGGIVHAFNGSLQQAQAFLQRGFCLGFGGASTYDGSRRIRALAATLPDQALVVETDAPDIPPRWIRSAFHDGSRADLRNGPEQLPAIGGAIAGLRGRTDAEFARLTSVNACRVLPRLAVVVDQHPIRPAG